MQLVASAMNKVIASVNKVTSERTVITVCIRSDFFHELNTLHIVMNWMSFLFTLQHFAVLCHCNIIKMKFAC